MQQERVACKKKSAFLSSLCVGDWHELSENTSHLQRLFYSCYQSPLRNSSVHAVTHLMYNMSLFFTVFDSFPQYLWDIKYHAVTTAVLTTFSVRIGFFSSGSVLPAQPIPINSLTRIFCCCLGWESTHDNHHSCIDSGRAEVIRNCSFLSASSCRTWWWLSIWWQRWSPGSCLCTGARNWRRLPFWWWWTVDSWRGARYQTL